jgi:3-oxoacyl-[acyl-carrier protein] reductase
VGVGFTGLKNVSRNIAVKFIHVLMRQEGKTTAIVTGSGRGIGKEAAVLLAKKGVNVVVCSRTVSEITSAVDEIGMHSSQANILGVKCDVGIPSQVNSLVKLSIDKFRNMDILVNNAGVAFNKRLVDTSDKEWDQTINTNLKGAFPFAKAVLPHMIKRKSGVIINVNSGAGKSGFSNLSSYCASKFGLLGLAECLALEVDAYNVRVMTIFLGQVATKMWQDFDNSYYEKNRRRMLNPHDVAGKIVEMIFDTKNYKNRDSVEMYNT